MKGNNFLKIPEIWQQCAAKGQTPPCRGSLGFMKDRYRFCSLFARGSPPIQEQHILEKNVKLAQIYNI